MVTLVYSIATTFGAVGSVLCKKNLLLEYLILCALVFLMGRGAMTLDVVNYKLTYEMAASLPFGEAYEKGYLLLQKIGHFFNLDYIQFRTALTITSWILIRRTFYLFTNKLHYVLFFYSLFAVFIDTVQIRNFFAFSVVLYGLRYVILPEKISKTKFVLVLLIAASIHISSLVYLCLLLVSNKNKKKLLNFLVVSVLLSCLFIFLGGNSVSLVYSTLSLLDESRLNAYIGSSTELGFLYAFVLHFFSMALLFYARKLTMIAPDSSEPLKKFGVTNNEIISAIYWINVVCIVFFPLYMVNLQFIRLSRNLLILNLLAFSLIQKPLFRQSPKILLLNILVIINTACWYSFTFIVQDHVEDIIDPFFDEKNILS